MPAYSIVKLIRQLCWGLLLVFSCTAHAETFSVEYAEISTIGNGHVLNAKINYPLTQRVKEALENGIPITFSQQLELLDSHSLFGKYWPWQHTIWTSELRIELSFHPLSRQYRLLDLATQHQRYFPSLSAALDALARISNLILPPDYFNNGQDLVLQIRSGLDLNALPTPMRPGALISQKWQLTSPWTKAQWR